MVHQARDHHRVPLCYAEGTPPIWMITDGCSTGVSGLVAQGAEWKTAHIAAFYSAKLNPAQQNYATHEVELLAGLETMLRHCDLLQGAKFKWVTDHKGLTYFLNQKNLSGRQARWLEKISSFNFEVVYVPGTKNVVADALSHIYSNDAPGTVRARSEYTYHDVVNDDVDIIKDDLPILAGLEARALGQRRTRVEVLAETGRPETSKEFAARVRDNFVLKGPRTRRVVLRGPREQKEGRSSPILQDTSRSAVSLPNEETMHTTFDPRQADQSLLVDLITSDAENGRNSVINIQRTHSSKWSQRNRLITAILRLKMV